MTIQYIFNIRTRRCLVCLFNVLTRLSVSSFFSRTPAIVQLSKLISSISFEVRHIVGIFIKGKRYKISKMMTKASIEAQIRLEEEERKRENESMRYAYKNINV